MGKRWSVATSPAILARIAEQDAKRGVKVMSRPALLAAAHELNAPHKAKTEPSAATKRVKKVGLANQESRKDSVTYDADRNTLTIVLAGAQLLSHNVASRLHDAKLTSLKNTWLKRMQALMLTNMATYDTWKLNQGRAFPLIIEEVYASGESALLDVEAVVAACKPIVDALVRTRFLPDDKPAYIAQPIAFTYRQPNRGLVLVLRPAPKPWGEIFDSTMEQARLIPVLSK
ncbi:hypothetical protein ACI77O_13095 [Pseudomonas tritici]|uniref:hypothetical protein n=1 Tax=Pseudomonas tritici TaxID=2745518 RepID=UPI00387B7DBB